MVIRTAFALYGLAVAAIAFAVPVRAESCQRFGKEIADAVRTGEAEVAAAVYGRAEKGGVCSGDALALLGRRVAKLWFKAAWRAENAPRRQAMLEKALSFGRPWQVLASLGDMAMARKDYVAATAYYQQALDDINDDVFNPRPPRREVIAAIVKKASESRLLAPRYVAVTTDRSGQPGGLARVKWRGFSSRQIPVPVQFEYRKARLNAEGIRAVRDMLAYLTAQKSPPITLVGHTDERGSRRFNLALSKKRARAVADWLKKAGYRGRIKVIGKGESEPYQPDDPGRYSQEERWQLDRRVELVRE